MSTYEPAPSIIEAAVQALAQDARRDGEFKFALSDEAREFVARAVLEAVGPLLVAEGYDAARAERDT